MVQILFEAAETGFFPGVDDDIGSCAKEGLGDGAANDADSAYHPAVFVKEWE